MSRRNRTVAAFALRAGMDPELALLMLAESAKLNMSKASAVIPKNKIAIAEVVLGLAAKVKEKKRLVEPNNEPQQPTVIPKAPPKKVLVVAPIPARVDGVPLIGRRVEIEYLNLETVENIHWFLVKEFQKTRDPIDPPGVRDKNLLNSALTRYKTSLGRDLKYPTLAMASAALIHSLIHNHPFHNGNKRTALVSTLAFLDLNGETIRCDEDELFQFIKSVGGHMIYAAEEKQTNSQVFSDKEVEVIARWIHSRMHRKMAPSRYLKYRELKTILSSYGCNFVFARKGYMNIECGDLRTQIWYGGEGREMDVSTVQKIRSELHLDEAHGCDTSAFYNAERRLPQFITKYRKVLDMLAKE